MRNKMLRLYPKTRVKENICPKCNSKNIIPIIYGFYYFKSDIYEKARQGKVELGGCCMNPDRIFSCKECKHEFGS